MLYKARVTNSKDINDVEVESNNVQKKISIPIKSTGRGLHVNGGELLFLSLATCFCNDLHREAARRKIEIDSIEVTVTGEFSGEGAPAFNIRYKAEVKSGSSPEEIRKLIHDVDQVAEIHKTVRLGADITLEL